MTAISPEEQTGSEDELPFQHQEQLLKLQKDILEAVATSNAHEEQLIKLCYAAEAILPQAMASVMLYDGNGEKLIVRSAPSIPEAAINQLNGLQPGPQAGSCGTAVYCGHPIYVENTLTDDRWSTIRQVALDFNINACWSNPIQNGNGKIIGSFALTSFTTCKPNLFQMNLLSVCANLAGVIMQREVMEHELQQLAYYDTLTHLPNRELLNQLTLHAIEQAHRHNYMVALLYIDVDNFKIINDSHGHNVGDEMLASIAKVMQSCLQEGDTLARTGGDEFIILLEDIHEPVEASIVAEKILNEVSSAPHPYHTDITLSIGISLFPDDAHNPQELMRNADTAMYAAKSAGKNNLYFYQPELTRTIQEQLALVKELRHALKHNEFVLYFQPIFDGRTLSLTNAETLIRWQHPNKGLLMPDCFIQTAEQNGLINAITDWVLSNACQKAKSWLDKKYNFNKISINLTADDIKEDFHLKVKQMLESTQLPAHYLELEITESILMEHKYTAVETLQKLRGLGVTIALDDFGTGYSSLTQLRQLPIDTIKIDRSFIKDIPAQEDDVILTRLIISMGKSLSLAVVAEGVETQEQTAFLKQEGCDYLQGFLYGKPMPEDEFLTALANNV